MNVRPLHDRVVIRRLDAEEKTAGIKESDITPAAKLASTTDGKPKAA